MLQQHPLYLEGTLNIWKWGSKGSEEWEHKTQCSWVGNDVLGSVGLAVVHKVDDWEDGWSSPEAIGTGLDSSSWLSISAASDLPPSPPPHYCTLCSLLLTMPKKMSKELRSNLASTSFDVGPKPMGQIPRGPFPAAVLLFYGPPEICFWEPSFPVIPGHPCASYSSEVPADNKFHSPVVL